MIARTRDPIARKSDFASVVATIASAAIVVASLLVLVHVRTAQIKVGYRVHDLESAVLKLKQERSALEVERASLLRPARLAELSRTTLNLAPVDASRVLDVHALSAIAAPTTASATTATTTASEVKE